MADPIKAPAPPQVVEAGVEFVRNPGGAIHTIEGHDREDGRAPHPALALAAKGENGWRFASATEIQAYCKDQNIELPDIKEISTRIARLRRAAEKPGAAAEAAAEETEPVTEPAGIATASDVDAKPAKKS